MLPRWGSAASLPIAGLFSLANIPSFLSAPDAGEVGPPLPILVFTSVLGVVGLVAVVMAWRGNRIALRAPRERSS